MLKDKIKTVVNRFGYDIHKVQPINKENGFEIYQYLKADGSFDYDKYKQVQSSGNKEKIDSVWVKEENILFLSDYINKNIPNVKLGLCHGTRRGKEQEWFKKYLSCDVIGTEISDTAEEFPDTIQWDFHEVKPEWIGAVDFIYSNSFDHSYDPRKCIKAWMSCINEGGLCILEHSPCDEHATELDPFGANISQMPYLILTWGEGRFYVKEILNAPSKRGHRYLQYLVIQNS